MSTYLVFFAFSVIALIFAGAARQDIVTFSVLVLPAVAFLTSVLFVVNDKRDNKLKAYFLSQTYGILNLVAVLVLRYISNNFYGEVYSGIEESIWTFSIWFSVTVIFLNLFLNIAIVALSRD